MTTRSIRSLSTLTTWADGLGGPRRRLAWVAVTLVALLGALQGGPGARAYGEEEAKSETRVVTKRKVPPRWQWDKKLWRYVETYQKKVKPVQGFQYKSLKGGSPKDATIFEDKTFYRYEEEDYIVWSDLSPRFTAELAVYTEMFVKEFPKIFPMPPRGKVESKLIIVIFEDREQYKAIVPAPMNEWSRGCFAPVMARGAWPEFTVYSYFYDGGKTEYDNDPDYLDMFDDDGEDKKKSGKGEAKVVRKGADKSITPANFCNYPYAVLQHEATHAMLRKYVGTTSYYYRDGQWHDLLPIFLNEGCATFFQNWDLRLSEKENLKRTAHLCNDRWLVQQTLEGNGDKDFDLDFLMRMVNGGGRVGTWAPDDGGPETALNYAVAQTYAHYLLHNRSGRKKFRDMMKNIYYGKKVLDERDLKRQHKAWNEHIREDILTAEGEAGESTSIHELKE